jgi:DNA-binding MarR family transcriptional regulator
MPTRTAPLTHLELDAWRSFLRAHARVTRVLDAELTAECDLPLGSYEVLLHLNDTPDRRLRMTELADRVLLSRSGLTRLCDRLEREGLIGRESCPSDLRGTNAVLTDKGLERLRAAAPVHLRGVREHIVDLLTPAEIRVLATALGRVAGPLVL